MKHYNHLTKEERYTIEKMRRMGHSLSVTARTLGRSRSTISREICRNSGQRGYRYQQAQSKCCARHHLKRKHFRLSPDLLRHIQAFFRQDWSPEQISGFLRRTGAQSVSHETIYQWIWKDKQQGGHWHCYLRRPCRRYRRRYGCNDYRGRIPGRVDIEQRPMVVDRRDRFGDWEVDTVHGAGRQGALVTLLERKTRITLVAYVPQRTKEAVADAIIRLLKPLAEHTHTLTFDNGREFCAHQRIAKALQCETYFARPYHSWERGANENANGLLRQYFPKKKPLTDACRRRIPAALQRLNSRPRKCLGFQTPAEMMNKLIGTDYNLATGVALIS